ncbi:unnamed protein product [Polarella glacialis]|uniref:Uncharacterized protein n=1 Tax=Polarella glacialis TaxID=89957 RepID=A0A813IHY5_POLGL|nr:unnamed protein product [Polarella glacialis]CAE8672330.1 unnamed protein product [Polarella glacialis]
MQSVLVVVPGMFSSYDPSMLLLLLLSIGQLQQAKPKLITQSSTQVACLNSMMAEEFHTVSSKQVVVQQRTPTITVAHDCCMTEIPPNHAVLVPHVGTSWH